MTRMLSQPSPRENYVRVAPRKERKSRLLGQGDIRVSFEFFPPKTAAMEETLWRSIRRLEPLRPTSVSVTYGAGGSTRERTHAAVARILRETSLKPAAHLTCVDAIREDVDAIVHNYWELGVRHIVALRGDPLPGETFVATPGGYASAAELVAGIRSIADFEISVAGYPEKHPQALTVAGNLDSLKAKVDAGATQIITQFFFDNEHFLRFEELARSRGIAVPIVPGILPIHDFHQVAIVAAKAGVSVPRWLARRFEGLETNREAHRLTAAAFAAEQVIGLVDRGVSDFHFYTLNRADLIYGICHMIGLRAQA